MRQMPVGAVKMIRQIRAAFAALLPSRTEHEMINDQLAASVEKVGQRLLATRPFKNIFFLDLDPRELTAMPAHFVA